MVHPQKEMVGRGIYTTVLGIGHCNYWSSTRKSTNHQYVPIDTCYATVQHTIARWWSMSHHIPVLIHHRPLK